MPSMMPLKHPEVLVNLSSPPLISPPSSTFLQQSCKTFMQPYTLRASFYFYVPIQQLRPHAEQCEVNYDHVEALKVEIEEKNLNAFNPMLPLCFTLGRSWRTWRLWVWLPLVLEEIFLRGATSFKQLKSWRVWRIELLKCSLMVITSHCISRCNTFLGAEVSWAEKWHVSTNTSSNREHSQILEDMSFFFCFWKLNLEKYFKAKKIHPGRLSDK